MRYLLIPALLLAALPARALDVTSRVDAVTVYPRGAAVTRLATLDLPAGTTTVRLTGLVDDIDPASLRIAADSAGIRLGQVHYGQQQQREAYNRDIERLNTEIRAINARIAGFDDAVRSAELRLKFLDSLAQGYAQDAWRESAAGDADVASWREALALLESASGEAYADIREQKSSREDAGRDLSVLKRELAELRGGARATSFVELSVAADRSVATTLRLEYFQDFAWWRPQYEARLASDDGRLTLNQQAEVAQQTGEPWRDIALSLSTSNPSGRLTPGDVESEFLDLARPTPKSVSQVAAVRASDGRALEEVVVTGNRVSARIGNYAVTYDIPGRVSVTNEADDTQSYDVATLTVDVELLTRVIPRDSEQAFLAARFEHDGTLPLYGNDMRVYVDGAYAGTADMPTALPGATVTLPMGEDRRVEVRLTDRGGERGREGIISRRNVETVDLKFEITNRRTAPTLIEVLDRYPVARNREVDVEIPRNVTAPDERDIEEKPGVVLWRNQLGAGETWRIEHGYTISWPSDEKLVRQ